MKKDFPLALFAKKILKLDENKISQKVFANKNLQLEVVRLNTEIQLFSEGKNIFGQRLKSEFGRKGMVYSNRTIFGGKGFEGKLTKHQPIDRVTLKDTGAFYATFKANVASEGLDITADTSLHGEDLQNTWGFVVGLDDENKSKAVEFAKPIFIQNVQNAIL